MYLNQTNFTGGEWSELLEGRVELSKYQNACRRLRNFLLYPHGPATYRPGFRYISALRDMSKVGRLIPFEFSSTQAYILLFEQGYIRVYKDQAAVTQTAQNITAITKANPAVVTYNGSDTYANSDRVLITGVVGMTEVNNREFTVANVSTGNNTFELSGIDSSAYTAYTSGGTVAEIYEVVSPYQESELAAIKYCQSADVLYLFHPSYAPRKLTRTGHTSWTLLTINFNPSALANRPFYPAATLTPGATSGNGVTFTAGASVFLAGDVGRVLTSGNANATITQYNSGTVVLADVIDAFSSTDAIAADSWALKGSPNTQLTPDATGPAGGTRTINALANAFRSSDVGKYIQIHGITAKITAQSVGQLTVTPLADLTSAAATTTWEIVESLWTSALGFPSCGTFFEERLWIAGTATYPDTAWGSKVGDYENFSMGTNAADAIEVSLGGRKVNVIRWIEPRDYLILGTMSGEWRLGPEDSGSAITPSNITAKEQPTRKGCSNYMPVTIDSSTLFIQRAGRKIRELTFKFEKDTFVAPDLTLLAEHVTESGLVDMAYQQEPFSLLWCVRDDGMLIALTYLREEEVVGWSQFPMGTAEVESVAVIPGTGYDELWAIIKRTVNGGTVRYVEMLEEVFNESSATYIANDGLNAFFVDSGLTYNSSSTTTISGLWHLRGETVKVLADGATQTDKVVSSTGKVTLSYAASIVHLGLGYTGTIQTMRPEVPLNSTLQGRIKRLIKSIVRVYRSGTFKLGVSESNVYVAKFRDPQSPMGQPSALFTGDTVDNPGLEGSYERDARIVIVQDKPLPLTVLSVTNEVEIG